MLHILLCILKIIGLIIAALLGVLILLVCTVLFVPIRYKGVATADGTIESAVLRFQVSWLFHLISGFLEVQGKKLTWKFRLFWKTFPKEKKDESKSLKAGESECDEEIPEEDMVQEDTAQDDTVHEDIGSEASADEDTLKKENETEEYTFGTICDKIKTVAEKKDECVRFIENPVHKKAWNTVKRQVMKLLSTLKPKTLKVNLEFGFEDPYHTGKVLAVLSMLYPFFAENMNIQPNFEEQILKGDAIVQGKIRSIHLVLAGVKVLLDKHVRTTYQDYKKKTS